MNFLWLPAVCAAAGLVAWGVNWVGLIAWRRAREAHWTERARLLFPVRATAGWNIYLVIADVVLAGRLLAGESFPPWWAAAIAAWIGTIAAGWPSVREIHPRETFRNWLHQIILAWLFYFAGWGILLAAIAIAPAEFHPAAAAVALVVVALQAWLVWHGSIWLSQKLDLIEPAPEHLHALVAQVAARTHIKVKRVWVIHDTNANAMAWPLTGDIGFTDRILELLTDDELAAVCAHELGHLAETRWSRFGRYLASLTFLPWILVRPIWSALGVGGIIGLGAFTYFVSYLMGQHSRLQEVHADRTAHITENNDGAVARALSRLYEDNQTPAVLAAGRYTHPNLYDRLIAAGMTPDYPRPEPAETTTWGRYFLVAALIVLLLFTLQYIPEF